MKAWSIEKSQHQCVSEFPRNGFDIELRRNLSFSLNTKTSPSGGDFQTSLFQLRVFIAVRSSLAAEWISHHTLTLYWQYYCLSCASLTFRNTGKPAQLRPLMTDEYRRAGWLCGADGSRYEGMQNPPCLRRGCGISPQHTRTHSVCFSSEGVHFCASLDMSMIWDTCYFCFLFVFELLGVHKGV